jgi:type III restriction enzyme
MKHWELDRQGQPTEKIVDKRRPAEFITPTLRQESNQLKPNNNNSYLMKV